MFFLKYIFGLRERSVLDEEKPFLSHLEDLRRMLLRVVATLVISMIVCFNFAPSLLNFLRLPVEEVWVSYETSHLPSSIPAQDWIAAKKLADVMAGLPSKAQHALLKRETVETRNLAEAALILRAMKTLPKEVQRDFLQEAVSTPALVNVIEQLSDKNALTQAGDAGSGLKMMSALQPSEAFNLSLKLALYAGIVLSFPLLLYFVLEFILPGLRENEKKALFLAMGVGFGLFLTGASFAYFMVLPRILEFFFSYSMDMSIANDWRIGYYLTFTLNFVMLFGLSFELPVVVMPFVKLGILTYEMMKATRRYAIVVVAILSAVLTPQDVLSMLMMGIPMYLLYEICIFLAWKNDKKRALEELKEKEHTIEDWEEKKTPYQENPDKET